MQFTNFSRLQDGLTITFRNEVPIENVGTIKYYSDNATPAAGFLKKEFRWGFNNEHWAAWQPLTQSNVSFIDTYSNYYFFLQIRYTLRAVGSANVTTFTLNYLKGTATPSTPRILTHDIQSSDASAILIHDILQSYEVIPIRDASTLNGYSGAYYLNRANHKGTQPISSIAGLQTILNNIYNISTIINYDVVDGGNEWYNSYDVVDGGSEWKVLQNDLIKGGSW